MRKIKLIACSWSLRCADHSSKGVLPSVECPMSVIEKPRKKEALTRDRIEAPQNIYIYIYVCVCVWINQLTAKSGKV
jgi:hypothetical protein